MHQFFVYILKCADNSYYVGRTNNIEQRLAEHRGKIACIYTAIRLPIKLVYLQECSDENEAYFMEMKLKKWSRKKKEALITGNWQELIRLAHIRKN